MIPDYHLHTSLCKHAQGTTLEYVEKAKEKGIKEICFTDHCPNPDGYDPEHRMTMDGFTDYRHMVLELIENDEFTVLFGTEADYYDGCENFLRDWLPLQSFDFVLGSVHFIDQWGFDNPDERHIWDSVDVRRTWQEYFHLIGRLADSGLFDAVGHLDIPKKFGYRPSDNDLAEMAQPVLERIARAGMGLEINTAGLRKPVGEIYPSIQLLSLARKQDIPICFGSDAHLPGEVGRDFRAALELARLAGYTHYFRTRKRKKILVPLP